MKRLLLLLLVLPMLLVYPITADAMKMSEPIHLGGISYVDGSEYPDGGAPNAFSIDGATANTGKKFTKWEMDYYKKGCAAFGKGDLTIYAHYSDDGCYIGGKNRENTIEMGLTGHSITAVKTDSGIVFYVIDSVYGEGNDFVILGKLPDGRFIKYVDSFDLAEKYHLWDSYALESGTAVTEKNTIIIPYFASFDDGNDGNIRFTWDDKAQWFGVEKR